MPLFRRRNKAGTAEGPVVETNPNIFDFDRPLPLVDQRQIESKYAERIEQGDKEVAQYMELKRKAREKSE